MRTRRGREGDGAGPEIVYSPSKLDEERDFARPTKPKCQSIWPNATESVWLLHFESEHADASELD
ncbi:unnamed protein product [Protopolystoma xenopodis]|uniref:Uncharacterized protein n=1 Tax=Protopolystoma xenopodis TaxID=117903 RepID=A0A3S5AJD3_9PLAT|nr:unnamed protein product [Protopolystoma xenopodis]